MKRKIGKQMTSKILLLFVNNKLSLLQYTINLILILSVFQPWLVQLIELKHLNDLLIKDLVIKVHIGLEQPSFTLSITSINFERYELISLDKYSWSKLG